MVFIDDDDNSDWTKQTFDLYDDEGLVTTDKRLEIVLERTGVTMREFRELPAYQGYLKVRKDEETDE